MGETHRNWYNVTEDGIKNSWYKALLKIINFLPINHIEVLSNIHILRHKVKNYKNRIISEQTKILHLPTHIFDSGKTRIMIQFSVRYITDL